MQLVWVEWLKGLHGALLEDGWSVWSGFRLWRYVAVLWFKFHDSVSVRPQIRKLLLYWISVFVMTYVVCNVNILYNIRFSWIYHCFKVLSIWDFKLFSIGLKNIFWLKQLVSTYWVLFFCCPMYFYLILRKC